MGRPFGGHLLNSEFNTVTADDTAALCHLAGLGRDLKTWKRIKAAALYGFPLGPALCFPLFSGC